MTRLLIPTMQKLSVSRGGNSYAKQHLSLPTIPRQRHMVGCCARIHLYEENARFLLLGLLMVIYLLLGAAVFQQVERPTELHRRLSYQLELEEFYHSHPRVNRTALMALLHHYGNLTLDGYSNPRQRWDFSGSFYFVGTVVSTIGFGMTTPQTPLGKILVICYGFFGCAGAILFFNLFLERIITVLAYLLRFCQELKEKRIKPKTPLIKVETISDSTSEADSLEAWKPSVLGIMASLLLMAGTLVSSASLLYSQVEEWPYLDALYFCFVSFATIGFGDLVPSQQPVVSVPLVAYRMGNFLILTLGCCCIYSLFNVTSIVIRQLLNRIIKLLDCRCERPKCCRRRKNRRHLGLGLRTDVEIPSDEESSRRGSDAVVSLKEFLEHNKLSLVMMQKLLIEHSKNKGVAEESRYDTSMAISASAVGPLAIIQRQLGDDV